MERSILTSNRDDLVVDRGRKFGISFSHELANVLYISKDTDRVIGIKNTILKSQTGVV